MGWGGLKWDGIATNHGTTITDHHRPPTTFALTFVFCSGVAMISRRLNVTPSNTSLLSPHVAAQLK